MVEEKQPLSLQQLVDLFEEEDVQQKKQDKQSLLLEIFTHKQIKPSLKNQALILKRIFTYPHLALLIQFLKQENKIHARELTAFKYDPSGNNIPLCLKLPFMAMEILCCQCQLINQLLFNGSDQQEPLLPTLLQFLDHPPHYHLACYFSKVMSAITKRVSSSSHKYNPIFCRWIFGEKEEEDLVRNSALFKSIRHFYSLSTLDYVSKWLMVSSKEIQRVEEDGKVTEKTIVNFRRPLKIQFLLELVRIVNKNLLEQEIISNIASLFQQMLSHTQKSKNIPGLSLKSLGPSSHAPKASLYDLVAQEQLISPIFEVPEEGCLTGAKLNLIKVFLQRYVTELQSLRRKKGDEEPPRRLLAIINSDNLLYLFEWMVEHLKITLQITTKDIASQNSPHIQQQTIAKSRVCIGSSQKMLILQICEAIRIIQGLQVCRGQLIQYYNEHSSSLVNVITRLMTLDNNLIHLETSKIVLGLIRPRQKQYQMGIPNDFARKLLLHSILQLIEQDSIKAHVIQWADILLSLETEHIFEDYEEEFEWEHVRQIVQQAKQIYVGQYKMVQANIDWFYSEEKAELKYSNFLHNYKAVVLYDDKKDSKTEEKTTNYQQNIKPANVTEDGESSQLDLFFLSDPNDNYLKYDLDELINDL